MELWSKGLGKRVLGLGLGERTSVAEIDDQLAIGGTMHAPTYWDYSVDLDGGDVVEFIGLLENPETVRFLANDKSLPRFLRTALAGSAVFLARTVQMALSGPSETANGDVIDDSDWPEEGEIDDDGLDGERPARDEPVFAQRNGSTDGRS